jgi:hypothetical protein
MLTAERLRDVLAYDPDTGVFTWLVDPPRGAKRAGSVAGIVLTTGYRQIKVDGRKHLAHRLAFLHVHGRWPEGDLDHSDGNRANNAAANLREATETENQGNMRRPSSNSSGFKGVSLTRWGWRAGIKKHGRSYNLGTFKTPEEAHAAYVNAASRLFGEFARAA